MLGFVVREDKSGLTVISHSVHEITHRITDHIKANLGNISYLCEFIDVHIQYERQYHARKD